MYIYKRCLATPCHTQDSICYYVTDPTDVSHPGGLFTGDTLFIGGCGRFFEGTADEMIHALRYLGSLPDKTIVYNGHEYTASNLAFGKFIEPNSSGIARLSEIVKNNNITTGKTTVGEEKEWNVFMRLNTLTVRQVNSEFFSPIACAYDLQGENERRTNDFRYRYHELFKRAEEQLQRVNKLQIVVLNQVSNTTTDSHRACEIDSKKMYQQDVSFDFSTPPVW